uniref:BRCA1-associated ATM activator 1 n=1 Tax=Pundamilia nyererei TaxID=303518 RepID=A0A3B4G9M0_9CICH
MKDSYFIPVILRLFLSKCVSLLPRVCEVLAASGSSLPDDTILEKLLDWFTARPRWTRHCASSYICIIFVCLFLDFIEPLLQLQTDTSLFVASAANQMLSHVLLFCQPVSSIGCNGTNKKEDDAQLHQCQQTLRLLALLLGQTKPPLHDKLLQTVTASLEEMVAADCNECVFVFQVLHKSYQALVKWMSVCTDVSFITDQLRHGKSQHLVQVVKKRACDMRWEVRDSTMEFLGHLGAMRVCRAPAEQACDASEALLGGCCCTTPLLREALQDPESYVRASAIKALWFPVVFTDDLASTEIVTRLLEILSQDTEGFARRAVVKFFIAWFSSHTSHTPPSSPSVRSVLSRGCADLDWEVKVHTLELAELLLDKAFLGHGSYTKGSDDAESDLVDVLKSLVEQGVISALLSGLVDCDRPVALKACRLLITLRVTVCPASQGDPDVSDATATVARVSCELPRAGWAQEIRKILGVRTEANAERDLNALNATSFEDHSEEGASAVSHCERVSVCEALGSLGLDDRLEILSRSSDHVHNSPLSLLQDILTASTSHTHSNTQPGQEVIVDCY